MERILSVGGNKASRPIDDFLLEKSKVWYVGPNEKDDGDDGRSGRSKETSLATLDEAMDRAVASTTSYNDIIYVLPNHSETVSTAGMINLDKIGLRVIGLGTGAYRPTFTFSAVDATILMSAASCSFENMILVPSADSIVSGIVVSAADCKVDVEVHDTTDIEFVTAVLTTAGADRLDLSLKYRGYIGGNACVAPIQLVGVDTARIFVDFYGKASTAVVNFITTACLNIDIKGFFFNSGTALTKNVVDTQGSSTWSVRGWDGVNNASFSGGDNAAIASDDVTALASAVAVIDGYHDVPGADGTTNTTLRDVVGNKEDATVGTVTTDKSVMGYIKGILTDTGTTIPATIATAQADLDILTGETGANLLTATQASIDAIEVDTGTTIPATLAAVPQCVVKTDGACLSGLDPLFTVAGGPVRCKIVGLVTTVIGATTASFRLQHITTEPAATVELNAGAVAVTDDAAGTFYRNVGATSVFTPSAGLGFDLVDPVTVEETEFLLAPGVVQCLGSAANTGVIAWYMTYTPLSPNSVVTAAA
jgi:hypothetical protein